MSRILLTLGVVLAFFQFSVFPTNGTPHAIEVECFLKLVGDWSKLPAWFGDVITAKRDAIIARVAHLEATHGPSKRGDYGGDDGDDDEPVKKQKIDKNMKIMKLGPRIINCVCDLPSWYKEVQYKTRREILKEDNDYPKWFRRWYKQYLRRKKAEPCAHRPRKPKGATVFRDVEDVFDF